jgi:hypothetical protein
VLPAGHLTCTPTKAPKPELAACLLQSPALPSILVPGKSWYLHKLYGGASPKQQQQQQQQGQAAAGAAGAASTGGAAAGNSADPSSSRPRQASMFCYSAEMLAASRCDPKLSRSGSRQDAGQGQGLDAAGGDGRWSGVSLLRPYAAPMLGDNPAGASTRLLARLPLMLRPYQAD